MCMCVCSYVTWGGCVETRGWPGTLWHRYHSDQLQRGVAADHPQHTTPASIPGIPNEYFQKLLLILYTYIFYTIASSLHIHIHIILLENSKEFHSNTVLYIIGTLTIFFPTHTHTSSTCNIFLN